MEEALLTAKPNDHITKAIQIQKKDPVGMRLGIVLYDIETAKQSGDADRDKQDGKYGRILHLHPPERRIFILIIISTGNDNMKYHNCSIERSRRAVPNLIRKCWIILDAGEIYRYDRNNSYFQRFLLKERGYLTKRLPEAVRDP